MTPTLAEIRRKALVLGCVSRALGELTEAAGARARTVTLALQYGRNFRVTAPEVDAVLMLIFPEMYT